MKKLITYLIVVMISLLGYSCYYDEPLPNLGLDGPPGFVSFQDDLIPIFNAKCNTSGCHDSQPSHNPSLVAGKAYNDIVNGGYINTIAPKSSILFTEVNGGNMPIGGQLNEVEIKQILDWVRNGAPKN